MAAKAARKSSHSCEPSSTTLPRKDPKAELEERDRQAELGRNDARNEDRGGEECCKLDGLHDDLLKRRLTNGVEAISAGARLWREPHRSARRVAVRFSGSSPRLSSDVR
jgi:hypothetical protein